MENLVTISYRAEDERPQRLRIRSAGDGYERVRQRRIDGEWVTVERQSLVSAAVDVNLDAYDTVDDDS